MNIAKLNQQQFARNAQPYAAPRQARHVEAHRRFVDESGDTAGQRVLDVACGPGFVSCELARVADQTVAVDITPEFLEMAERRARAEKLHNISFEYAEASRLPFPDNTYDLAICRAAFHHFEDPSAVACEMARVTKDDGGVVIADMVASEDPAQAAYHNEMERLCDKSHFRALTVSQFTEVITAAGLEIASVRASEMDYEVAEWIAHAGVESDVRSKLERLLVQAEAQQELTDLGIRYVSGELHLTHQTRMFLCAKQT